MLTQLIRQGDVVVFSRAHEHERADQGSFLVEEVIPPGGKSEVVGSPMDFVAQAMSSRPYARIKPIEGSGAARSAVGAPWQLVSVDALRHDPKAVPERNVVVAPGFLGNPDQWCWWDTEYPGEGAYGGYQTRERAIAAIEREEAAGLVHCHVSVTTATKREDGKGTDARAYRRDISELRAQPVDPSSRDLLSKVVGEMRGRRFYYFHLAGTLPGEEGLAPEQLRVTLVGEDPFDGFKDRIIVEGLHRDLEGKPSWQVIYGDTYHYRIAVYWLVRQLAALADRHCAVPPSRIGTITMLDEVDGRSLERRTALTPAMATPPGEF